MTSFVSAKKPVHHCRQCVERAVFIAELNNARLNSTGVVYRILKRGRWIKKSGDRALCRSKGGAPGEGLRAKLPPILLII